MTLGERYDFHVLYSQCYSGRVHLVHAYSGEQYIKREPNMLITRSYMRVCDRQGTVFKTSGSI